MNFIKIDKNAWETGIEKARNAYELFGPVESKNGPVIKPLAQGQYPDMNLTDTVMSVKSVIFPQSEKMFSATLDTTLDDHHIMKPASESKMDRAVIGIRPYDAKAMELVKLNFITDDYTDPYWKTAYDATTFIGLAITAPGPVDFSTAAGSGPFDEQGLDILLADMDDHYMAKVLTDKGASFAQKCEFSDVTDAKEGQILFDVLRKDAEAKIQSSVETDQLKSKTILDLYDAPFWDDIAFSCINCGTCTYVCPTCWCFDIQDETKNKQTCRYKNWDTCMSSLFTHHASGHNPRAQKTQRVRQRFMHKLKYFVDKYDQGIMCVGCGRCVKSCPVNIDIRDVCKTMNAFTL